MKRTNKAIIIILSAVVLFAAVVPVIALTGGSYSVNTDYQNELQVHCSGEVNVSAKTHTGSLVWMFYPNGQHSPEYDYSGSIVKKYYNTSGVCVITSTTTGADGQHTVSFSHTLPGYSMSKIKHIHKINGNTVYTKTIY